MANEPDEIPHGDKARERKGEPAPGSLAKASDQALPAEAPTRDEFNRRYNLAYLEEGLPRASIGQVVKHYFASVAIYGSVLLLLILNPWFSYLLSLSCEGVSGDQIYKYLFGAYVVLAPVLLVIGRPRSLWKSKNLLIMGFIWRVVRAPFVIDRGHRLRSCKPTYQETQALMFLLVKVVYGPLMLHSALLEWNKTPMLRFRLTFDPGWLDALDVYYLLFISAVFMADSLLFFVGYTTESGLLRNRLRFVETNVFRILVCIACYAPFNMVTGAILGPSSNDVGILFHEDLTHPMTWILRGFAVLCLLLLISSSLSLFTRASNLTNRGIVKYGPYAFVRHPGYIAKNLFWLTTLIPVFIPDTEAFDFSWGRYALVCATTLLGWLGWASLYFGRALTEEQFLRRDPDYVAYCQKVKYRFIPWVW